MSTAVPVPRLRLLGGFDLHAGARRVPVPPAGQRVVAYLALHGRSLARGHLAGTLWPDVRAVRAAANLRAAVWRAASPDVAVLVASRTHVRLDDAVVVDHEAAVECARHLLDPAAATPDGDATSDLAGELLPGWDADWVVLERERLRQLRLHALDALCDRLTAAGRAGEAVEAGLVSVAAEPLRESAHRCLIRAHLSEGNVAAALRQYEAFRRLLANELGVTPSPLAEAMVRDLLRP
jgi:DNA-binding SARP family transcriptional activator